MHTEHYQPSVLYGERMCCRVVDCVVTGVCLQQQAHAYEPQSTAAG
jgi:hypothetical protein